MTSECGGGERCKSVASTPRACNRNGRNARHESVWSMRCRKLTSELSTRSRRLARGGVGRIGRGLHMRRCAGAR